jgi:hypothetical protein
MRPFVDQILPEAAVRIPLERGQERTPAVPRLQQQWFDGDGAATSVILRPPTETDRRFVGPSWDTPDVLSVVPGSNSTVIRGVGPEGLVKKSDFW